MSSFYREGDWTYASCQHVNFKKRDMCHQCSCPKNAKPEEIASYAARLQVLAGDWFCGTINCGAHNYACRLSRYRCGTHKEYSCESMSASPDSIPRWKSGDWICSRAGCSMHNYASRTECYKCKFPKAQE